MKWKPQTCLTAAAGRSHHGRNLATEKTTELLAVTSPSLYKYVDVKGLKRILLGTIRFTQPGAFNDPFELLPELAVPANEPEKQLSISFDVMAKRRYPPVGEIEISDQRDSNDTISRNIVKQLNNSIGMLCLSEKSDSLLMWSHYSNQYAGAVLEFDGSNEFFDGQAEVEYRALRPKKDISAYLSAHEPVPVSELCVKSDQWEYEREVRVIRSLSDCKKTGKQDERDFPIYIREISNECIKSVTLGERTKVSDQRCIYELVKETSIALSLAAIDHRGYAFRRETIKFNVPVSSVGPTITPRTAHIFSHLKSPLGDVARLLIAKHPLSEIVNNTM
jgi:hypothetical protein